MSKSVALDRGINDINNVDPDDGQRLIGVRNGDAHMAASRKLYTFLREFGDRIATDSVNRDEVVGRWKALCHGVNETLGALNNEASLLNPEDSSYR